MATLASSLQDFIAREDGSTESVIIEVAAPVVAPPERALRDRRAHRATGSAATVSMAAFDAVSRALDKLHLPTRPVKLEELQQFVADVTPAQLRRIADLPMVAAIRPNRTRRAPRPRAPY